MNLKGLFSRTAFFISGSLILGADTRELLRSIQDEIKNKAQARKTNSSEKLSTEKPANHKISKPD